MLHPCERKFIESNASAYQFVYKIVKIYKLYPFRRYTYTANYYYLDHIKTY